MYCSQLALPLLLLNWKQMKHKKTNFVILFLVVITATGLTLWYLRPQKVHKSLIIEDQSFVQEVPEGWESLFDGNTLTGWEVVQYGGEGEPYVLKGALVIPRSMTGAMTGIYWVGHSLPTNNYSIFYEARRVEGLDIFAGLSFPYGETAASLILGGWAGIVNGLSSINGYDASENETTQLFTLNDDQWYPVQLHVTPDSIKATVGDKQVVDLATAGKDIHLRSGLPDTGLTFWTYGSTGEIRNIRIKRL